MRNKEGCLDVTTVGILQAAGEESVDLLPVVGVHRVVEGDHDHLRHLLRRQVAGSFFSRQRTETFR